MTKKFIKILIIFTIFFIVGIFYISLNKNSQYDTKYLIGYKIKNINLNHFNSNKIITSKDLKKNNFTLKRTFKFPFTTWEDRIYQNKNFN